MQDPIPVGPEFVGELLLAVPSLNDPNFARSVIFLAQHSPQDGAFGYILNRPLEKRVADLMPDQDLGPLGQIPVYIGGPVNADKLAFVSLHWVENRQILRCRSHLAVEDALEELALGHDVRGFVGYSGWSEGQLEKELERRTWINLTPQPFVLTTQRPAELWRDLLRGMGSVYEILADVPENIGLN